MMRKDEALQILEARLAAIEQDHEVELAENEHHRERVDARAEAQALTAVFDFLQNSKIAPTASLLRLFRRYLHAARGQTPVSEQAREPRSRAS